MASQAAGEWYQRKKIDDDITALGALRGPVHPLQHLACARA